MTTVPFSDLQPGDLLYRSLKGFEIFEHWGNYAGRDYLSRHWVFEHVKGGGCRLSLFDDFAIGYAVKAEKIEDSQRFEAVNRMRELLANPRGYDVLDFNCEHASRYIGRGKKESKQVGSAFLALGALAFLFFIVKD